MTQQKRVATDTWRSLGYRTTPLEHWSRRKPTVEPRWAKQQTKKLKTDLLFYRIQFARAVVMQWLCWLASRFCDKSYRGLQVYTYSYRFKLFRFLSITHYIKALLVLFQLHIARWLDRMVCGRSRVRSSRPATFFRGVWSWNNSYGHSLPSADSRRAVSVTGERMCTKYWLTA